MSESNESPVELATMPSPPPAPSPPAAASDPAMELRRLAERLVRGPDRRGWIEYLRLRRARHDSIAPTTQP